MNVFGLPIMAPSYDPLPCETVETSYYIATTLGGQAVSQAVKYGVCLESLIFDDVHSDSFGRPTAGQGLPDRRRSPR